MMVEKESKAPRSKKISIMGRLRIINPTMEGMVIKKTSFSAWFRVSLKLSRSSSAACLESDGSAAVLMAIPFLGGLIGFITALFGLGALILMVRGRIRPTVGEPVAEGA